MKRNHLHSPSPLSALLICRILSHDINCFVLLPSLFGRSWILSGSDVYLLDHLPHLEPQVLFCSMSTSFLFFNLFCIDSLWIIHCLSSCWLFIHSSSLVSETSSLLRAPIGAFQLYWGLFLQAFFVGLNGLKILKYWYYKDLDVSLKVLPLVNMGTIWEPKWLSTVVIINHRKSMNPFWQWIHM